VFSRRRFAGFFFLCFEAGLPPAASFLPSPTAPFQNRAAREMKRAAALRVLGVSDDLDSNAVRQAYRFAARRARVPGGPAPKNRVSNAPGPASFAEG
jgi:hypothetical protein